MTVFCLDNNSSFYIIVSLNKSLNLISALLEIIVINLKLISLFYKTLNLALLALNDLSGYLDVTSKSNSNKSD